MSGVTAKRSTASLVGIPVKKLEKTTVKVKKMKGKEKGQRTNVSVRR